MASCIFSQAARVSTLLLLLASRSASSNPTHWTFYPVFTENSDTHQTHAGLQFSFTAPPGSAARISISATQDHKEITAVDEVDISGDPTGGFLKVSGLTNLDTFRVRRISIRIGSKGWAYDNPKAGVDYVW